MTPLSLWQLVGALAVCGAFIPGPCTFDPHREFDCSLGDPCGRNFACADDGYCKSADVACLDGETRCEYPDRPRVGICVKDEDFQSSKTHCGTCFTICRGAGTCVDGLCQGEPADGRCVLSRGNTDCAAGQHCADDGDGDDEGDCKSGAGAGGVFDGCDTGADCASGLCAGGACTNTCDFGCALGATCDDAAVPGGLCVPDDAEVCR